MADPFFSKFGTIVDQPRSQKTVKRHFWKIISGDYYSKKIVKSGKFIPFFDHSKSNHEEANHLNQNIHRAHFLLIFFIQRILPMSRFNL